MHAATVHPERGLCVLGVACYYHDAAACVLEGGRLLAAAQEERFSRVKFDRRFPVRAVDACLRQTGRTIADVDAVAYYEDAPAKANRQLWQRLAAGRPWTHEDALRALRVEQDLRDQCGYDGRVLSVGHHEAHALSAHRCSGFEHAAVLVADGVGEWDTTTWWRGGPEGLERLGAVRFPHSLGLFYSMVTDFLGFEPSSDEYKVMGLAAYGRTTHLAGMRELVRTTADGYELDTGVLDVLSGDHAARLGRHLGVPPRRPGTPVEPAHQDVARSAQARLEEVLLHLGRLVHDRTGLPAVCLAGGVALNCVANRRLIEEGPFRAMFVQPAAGDCGTAVGAALAGHARLTGHLPNAELVDVRLGPAHTSDEVATLLAAAGVPFQDHRGRETELLDAVAGELAGGRVVGWFQGRMEFGPRALGARSILADPRDPDMRGRLNGLVKHREDFRPFAPSVLAGDAPAWFALDRSSRFMIDAAAVRRPERLPAVTHVDGSARVHTVEPAVNPRFARLLERFRAATGVPVLLNTSFNLSDEPIVCSAGDALLTFCRSALDVLCIEDLLVRAGDVPDGLRRSAARYAGRWRAQGRPTERDVYTFF